MSTSDSDSDISFCIYSESDEVNESEEDDEEDKGAEEGNLEKLKSLRDKCNWEIVKDRRKFLRKFLRLIDKWEGQLPDLKKFLRSEEIDWLISESYWDRDDIYSYFKKSNPLFEFVIKTGYKGEPDIDEDGKPLLRRATAIHHAVTRRLPDELIGDLFRIIYDRFDANYTDEFGFTHFHAACMAGCDDAVEKFLELGQNPNLLVKNTGDSPLHLALRNNKKKVVELLLKNGANPNFADANGLTPLHFCVRFLLQGDLMFLFFKINDDINQTVQVNARDNDGDTPLHFILKHYFMLNMSVPVELLLRRGADPNLADTLGSTPLHLIGNDVDSAEILFRISEEKHQLVQVDARDRLGNTPLHKALYYGHKKMAELLLRRGADPNMANNNGSTSLHRMCKGNQLREDNLAYEFFKITDDIQQRVQINVVDNLGRTPLQWAVAKILPNVVDAFLDRGADLPSFVFPDESYFGKELSLSGIGSLIIFHSSLASGAMSIVERLEKRGYELNRSDAITIMKFVDKYKFFAENSMKTHLDKFWYDDEEFVSKAEGLMVNQSLSLYDLIRLRPEEAAKQFSYTDYFEFACSNKLLKLPESHQEACAAHLCEKLSRGFFRSWALDCFLKLTRDRLPILCCDMVIGHLMNKDLMHICLAAQDLSLG